MSTAEFENAVRERIEDAIAGSPAEDTEILVTSNISALTRFANNQIHQNHHEENAEVTVRCAVGRRWGTVTTNSLDPEALKKAVDDAADAARLLPDDPEFIPSAEGPYRYSFTPEFDKPTAECEPSRRALMVKKGFEKVPDGYEAAGTLSTGAVTLGVFSARGISAITSATTAEYTILLTGKTSSGYAEETSRRVTAIDPAAIAKRAAEKAIAGENPRSDLDIGRYTVILEEEAVATFLMFFSWTGFGGQEFADGESFLCGRLGEKITGENITIVDDAADPRTFGLPFDFEGMPRQRLTIIEHGIARGVAHSRKTASKSGALPTGHSVGPWGAYPTNLILSPGDSSRDEMIKATERGILVSRFHYSNVVDPKKTVYTGLTRDGTFLIENGEIACGLTNFRWTQNALEALEKADMISAEQRFNSAFFGGGAVVPAIRTHEFNFSGKSDH
ncbi:MAG: TldD/PmbA family protein [bacterium]|jgi:predicted Zn-dependent protease